MNIRQIWKPLLAPILVASISSGCDESTTAPTDKAALSHDRARQELPFRLSGDAVLADQELAPEFPAPSDFEGRCSVPSHFVISFSVAAQATHLGDVTAFFEHCTQLHFQSGGSTISDGGSIITTANADEIWTRYEKALGDEEQHQFIGGTGRFVGASGEAVALAECDRAAGTCVLDMEGVIVFDASDRSE